MTSLNQDMALKLLKNFINFEFLPRFCEQAFSLGGVVRTQESARVFFGLHEIFGGNFYFWDIIYTKLIPRRNINLYVHTLEKT